jgi:hypothetical protein
MRYLMHAPLLYDALTRSLDSLSSAIISRSVQPFRVFCCWYDGANGCDVMWSYSQNDEVLMASSAGDCDA